MTTTGQLAKLDDSRELAPPRLNQLANLLTTLALLMTVGISTLAPTLAFQWLRAPFLGAFVEHTLVFNGIGHPGWSAYDVGLNQPARYHLQEVDGVPVANAAELTAELVRHRVGAVVILTFDALGEIAPRELYVELQRFAIADLGAYFGVPYAIGLAYLIIGLWVYRLRQQEAPGRAFAVFCAGVAVALGTLFDLYTSHLFTRLWTAAVPLTGGALITLALVFPQEVRLVQQRPAWRWLGFLPAIAVAAVSQIPLFRADDPFAYVAIWEAQYFFLGLCILFFLALMLYRRFTASSPVAREQSRAILWGAVLAFLPLLVWLLLSRFLAFSIWAFLPPLVLFPLAVSYAILRYRLLNTDFLLGRGLLYLTLGALATLGYALLVFGIGLWIPSIPAGNPWLLGGYAAVLAMLLNPMRARLQATIDRRFFRGSHALQERLQVFSGEMTQAVDLHHILSVMRRQIDEAVRPAQTHIFLLDPATRTYAAYAPPDGAPSSELRFPANGDLARLIASERGALLLGPDVPLPAALERERARLAVLGAMVFAPLPGKAGLCGWLALGPRLSGGPYTRDDVAFLVALCDQAAVAVERAQVITDLERRVKELDVLSRVSQAVNFTLAFDDLLELIYAQSSKLVDTRHFRIVTHDARSGQLRYALFVENGERVPEEEQKAWPTGRGLVSDIVRTGLPILTADYPTECRQRGLSTLGRRYTAWLGVPLNAGNETLGAAVLTAYAPGVIFTKEQAQILQAIADQAATAIVRARLFRETEERARELATLNDLSQSLASTLDLDSLLERILTSATALLGTEAGTLFLTDPETGEQVFKVAVSPVAEQLTGRRMGPGVGFVGEAVATGKPLIVNDVQSDSRWYQDLDRTTGFTTRSLMVAPLVVKDRIIGAIEIINKRDRTPFDEHDRSLLAAFAGQAAVAIENARLYTLTDQALEARVDELSVMQRIDRELNVSLDVNKTMGITLDWAMRTTGAQAGLVGMVAPDGLQVIASRGYDDDAQSRFATPLPFTGGLLQRASGSGEPVQIGDTAQGDGHLALRGSTRSQLAVPIHRERETIGLIVLESDTPHSFTADHLSFTARLADHAAIAIANARLYAEVRRANMAKSEFVSFVSHELKTPMTSIKGYADLLAQGLVGPVNEMQAGFLQTIRSNVERMATLVSDLADISRMEAGRLRLEFASIPFAAVVDDVVRTTEGLFQAKKQTLEVQVQPDLPHVWGDQVRLVQVLSNLVSNAHKYTPENGHIRLGVESTANRWDPDGAPRVVHAWVQDDGLGIAEADRPGIFQQFFRADDRLARESPGTGLGLHITKNLVELQGGKIWFESEFRKGSTFHFTVPVAEDSGGV